MDARRDRRLALRRRAARRRALHARRRAALRRRLRPGRRVPASLRRRGGDARACTGCTARRWSRAASRAARSASTSRDRWPTSGADAPAKCTGEVIEAMRPARLTLIAACAAGLAFALTAGAQGPGRARHGTSPAASASATSRRRPRRAPPRWRTCPASRPWSAGTRPRPEPLESDARGRPMLALTTINRGESIAIASDGDDGGFALRRSRPRRPPAAGDER